MATNDYTAGATRHRWPGSLQAIEDIIIFNLDTNAVNQGAAGVAQCIPIKAGMEVLSVVVEVVTEEGGTLTVDVGDGADADGYIDGADMNATVGDFYTSVVPHVFANAAGDIVTPSGNDETDFGIIGGKFYTTADTIDILINDNADAAVMRITAEVKDLQGQMTFGIAKN